VPPTDIHIASQTSTSVTLAWTPIAYVDDGGGYEVLSVDAQGMRHSLGKLDKKATGFTATGLTAGASYSLLVHTITPPHGAQQNEVVSDDSPPLTFMLGPSQPQPATITIVLDAQPDTATNFKFTGGLGTFKLDDITPSDGDAYASSKTVSVAAGDYSVAQMLPNGWLLTNIGCNPPDGTVADLAQKRLSITAAAGANITCTFYVQRAGQVIGGSYNDHNHNHRQNRGDEWLPGWVMRLTPSSSSEVAAMLTNPEGRAPFTNLVPGSYTICETLQSGWYNITPGNPPTDAVQPCYSVDVQPGKAVWARFGNSTTPAGAARDATGTAPDIIVCDLPPTDDMGNELAPERDPWEEEEDAQAATTIFLPLVER
jgi:hypothetical protein